MNIEDSWRYDVHDKCIEMGLDPDSKRDCQKANRHAIPLDAEWWRNEYGND
jgi:hypothetical protein